jgi:hypothetical protein
MSIAPNVLLACVHFYSDLDDEKKSQYYDRLFVRLMKRSLRAAQLDRRRPLE